MKISTKGRYGLRTLIDLAVHEKEGCVSLACIASRNQLSLPYLEHVFASLKKAGVVKSIKGPQGGYNLADKPEHITVAKILTTLDGEYKVAKEEVGDSIESKYITQAIDEKVWKEVNGVLGRVLENTTLKDLVDEYRSISQNDNMMYFI